MVDSVNFATLARRPPTPPRSSSFILASSHLADPRVPNSTPGELSSTPDLSPHPLTGTHSKKVVNFSPLTSYIKPPVFPSSDNKTRTPLRSLRPSNQCKPVKSILKPTYSSPITITSDEPRCSSPESFPAMLESVTQQLSGDSRSSRSDAYKQLIGSLSAYRQLPDEDALANKTATLCQFVRRDICDISPSYPPLEAKLVRQALKFLTLVLWKPDLCTKLPDDLKTFFLDHTIGALQNPSVPKTIVNDYMRVLSVQCFSSKVLTNQKVIQLLTALEDITQRVEGKAVVAQRIAIYERLLFQSRPTFTSQSNLWMDHLITALFHNVKEVRAAAMKFGLQAASVLGPNTTVSHAIRSALDVSLDSGSKLIDELRERLMSMMSNDENGVQAPNGVQVPGIWSVIVILLRAKRWSISQWAHRKDWLLIIQKCFNCSDSAIKIEALMAWDLFVFSQFTSDGENKDTITSMLIRPIQSQLERKRSDKSGPLINQTWLSYYNLLYYSFRPTSSRECLDTAWKAYVFNPFTSALNSDPTYNTKFCQILSFLLWNSQPRVWDPNMAIKSVKFNPKPVKFDLAAHLPRFECKWARSKLPSILAVFESLFKNAAWRDTLLHESTIAVAWSSLCKALSDAATKEITPSVDSMHAVAGILTFLRTVWKNKPQSLNARGQNAEELFCDRYQFLVNSIFSALGPSAFMDKTLSSTSKETFQVAPTPTHRRPPSDSLKSPILHLLTLVTTASPSTLTPAFTRLVHRMIEMSVDARVSRNSQLEMLRQFSESVSHSSSGPSDSDAIPFTASKYIWQTLSNLAKKCLKSFPIETTVKDHSDPIPHDYNKVVKILLTGTVFHSIEQEWESLLLSLAEVIRAERGEGVLTSITEPLAEDLLAKDPNMVLSHSSLLLDLAVFPSYRERFIRSSSPAIDKLMRSRHEGQAPSNAKLFNLVSSTLGTTYERLTELNAALAAKFVKSVTGLLSRAPSSFCPTMLEELQQGLAVWVKDSKRRLTPGAGFSDDLRTFARDLVRTTGNILRLCVDGDRSLLHKLAPLIAAGLESSHRTTVNEFIRMWNKSFGTQESVDYPDAVINALARLRPLVDLQLPTFPSRASSEVDLSGPEFVSSQEDMAAFASPAPPKHPSRRRDRILSSPPSRASTPISSKYDRRQRKTTPLRKSVTTPKARLRHDDSQIQFVPVDDSSPVSNNDPETQVLTENQREVRDRQRTEAAHIFPTIRSAGSRRSRHSDAQSPLIENADDVFNHAPLTPRMLPTLDVNEDAFPGSSPTPGSKDQAAQLGIAPSSLPSAFDMTLLTDDDPPSSPPQAVAQASKSHVVKAQLPTTGTENHDTRSETLHREAGSQATLARTSPDKVLEIVTPRAKSARRHANRNNDSAPAASSAAMVGKLRHAASDVNKLKDHEKQTEHPDTDSVKSWDQDMIVPFSECDAGDIVPDSFSDDLEQQIASQLEQDLELSIDSSVVWDTSQQSERTASPRSSKRKRGDGDSSRQARAKRVSPNSRSSSTADREPTSQVSVKKITSRGERSSSGASARPPATRRQSSRLRPSRNISPAPTADLNIPSNDTIDSQPVSPGRLKRRRSQRLNGPSSPEPAEEIPAETKRQKQNNSKKQNKPRPREGKDTFTEMVESTNAPNTPTRDSAPKDVPVSDLPPHSSSTPESPSAGILSSLRGVLASIKNAAFGRTVLREIDDVMFDIRVEAHDAARRYGDAER
ncbi:hypothetical protein AJ80_00282 [Polytolypa hystricis UAMH7299]|uniref:Telomere-associated protein Rif1 N-terminal domain-containing protein n=1 Tax=Polytolypa hystricis (strain UAMH7299) TaxID=1447883 RepID=A0A2B7Z5B0_POLH7|nr:hypothetical protein AJ80_00282 [Polytolypa hystricis UAMH7299]